MHQWNQIAEQFKHQVGTDLVSSSVRRVEGGDINESFCWETTDGAKYFIKTNSADSAHEMFRAEAQALSLIRASNTIGVPEVVLYGQTDHGSYLVLTYLELGSSRDDQAFGRQLAAMHDCTQAEFGWQTDNTIGTTPQLNSPHLSWHEFWINNRLTPQLRLAKANACDALLLDLGEQLIEKSPAVFSADDTKASMLHGDLWGGNAAALHDGTPVIYDPALYFGDRQVDLAMMELFGGFSADCFAAYFESASIDQQAYALCKDYYNLYHLLNHYNLFGGEYQQRCIKVMQQLLRQI